MQDVPIEKTLCKQCKKCEEFTYQRTIHHGNRKGELFKFQYCKGNVDVLKKGEWGPDTATLKDGTKREYVCSTKRFDNKARHFEYFLKKHPENVVLHLSDTLDLRMKKLREISKRCEIQSRSGKESIFPGVGLTSWYKANPTKAHGKKIWYTKVKIEGKEEYLENYYTELEAAHAYYSKMEELGLDINQETAAYKIYSRWLNVKKFTDNIINDIMDDYNGRDKVELEWYRDLIKNGIKEKKN